MPDHFAVWQHTIAVYGLGATEKDAVKDARPWMVEDHHATAEIESYTGQRLVARRFYVAACTDRLARAVDKHGGALDVAIADGQLDFPPLKRGRR